MGEGLYEGTATTHEVPLSDETWRLLAAQVPLREAEQAEQPRGGLVPLACFESRQVPPKDGVVLARKENVWRFAMDDAVRGLAWVALGMPAERAFALTRLGAELGEAFAEGQLALRDELLGQVGGLSDASVAAALRLCCLGQPLHADEVPLWHDVAGIVPDAATVGNTRTMAGRLLRFLEGEGNVAAPEAGDDDARSALTATGSMPFLAGGGLWDVSTSRRPLRNAQTLRLLTQWRQLLHALGGPYAQVRHLGFYNPKTNVARSINVSRLEAPVVVRQDRALAEGTSLG